MAGLTSVTIAAGLLLVSACRQVDEVRDYYRDMTSHEAYTRSLESAGLAETALGREWVAAARTALDQPLVVDLPYREQGYLARDEAAAMGFQVELQRGQRLTVEVDVVSESQPRVFVDLYRADRRGRDPLFVMSADSVTNELAFTVDRDGPYIVRIQPELLRGGEYRITLRSEASLAFPVAGAGTGNIQSFFGAARDGGRRSHHGVDIFMPRGTPVVAGATGRVSRVQVTNRGGKVIWLRDRQQRQSLYYAHLDSQIVRQGAVVRAGEVLGLVGNSGNARTTPPHLHFGIYRRGEGPVDPVPFLRPPGRSLPAAAADQGQIEEWIRVTVDGARVRSAPTPGARILRELPLHTPAWVDAIAGGHFRIRTPDGIQGYLAARLTEPTEAALRIDQSPTELALRALPDPQAPVVERTAPGSEIGVLGAYGDFLLVRSEARMGWLRSPNRVADDGG